MPRSLTLAGIELTEDGSILRAEIDLPYDIYVLSQAFKRTLQQRKAWGLSHIVFDSRCFGPVELSLKILLGVEIATIYQALVPEKDVRVAIVVSARHLTDERPASDTFIELDLPILITSDPAQAQQWVSQSSIVA